MKYEFGTYTRVLSTLIYRGYEYAKKQEKKQKHSGFTAIIVKLKVQVSQ